MMQNYTIFFEIGGKYMKHTVLADSERQAQEKIKNKIVFHKTEVEKTDAKVELLKQMFGIK